MKKSMITIGLLMGGFTATAAWAIDSVATAPVSVITSQRYRLP
ncbi:hypothetical protein OK016_00430 [Vibrio chagasii]|nr:hypothetical protein [Vibrio chagasii]